MSTDLPGRADKILIVDDETNITDMFSDLLSDAGYKVKVANDGEEAMGIIAAFRPDIVVSDLHMPKIDGDELYRITVKMFPEYATRFVFITGSEIDMKLRTFTAETNCVVVFKPFDIEDLIAIIKAKIHEKEDE